MKTIRKSQYNFLKLLEKHSQNRNELITISDEEYNNLSKYIHKPIDIIDDHDSDGHGSDDHGSDDHDSDDHDSDDHYSDENNIDENDISEYVITIPKQPDYYYKDYNYPESPFTKNGFKFSFPNGDTTQGYIHGISVNKFVGNKNITDVVIPNYILYQTASTNKYKVISLGGMAFENCINLINVHLNDLINHIYNYTFNGCTSLSNINTNNITYIDDYAFKDCISLTNIVLAETGCELGKYSFANCALLKNVENISTIPQGAFSQCYSLQSIKIPTICNIGMEAFYLCKSLTNIEIPDGVDSIGSAAFSDCTSLKTFISYSDTKFNLSDIFYESPNDENKTIIENIYVLDNLINQYQNDNYVIKYNVNVKSISEYNICTGISWINYNIPNTINIDETIEFNIGKIIATFNDGTTKDVTNNVIFKLHNNIYNLRDSILVPNTTIINNNIRNNIYKYTSGYAQTIYFSARYKGYTILSSECNIIGNKIIGINWSNYTIPSLGIVNEPINFDKGTIIATYSDRTYKDITNECTFIPNPNNNAIINDNQIISYKPQILSVKVIIGDFSQISNSKCTFINQE